MKITQLSRTQRIIHEPTRNRLQVKIDGEWVSVVAPLPVAMPRGVVLVRKV